MTLVKPRLPGLKFLVIYIYDNAKVVTLGRDAEGRTEWNRRMLDFALRLGFELKLCQPYRAQTKGKVESGVKHVRCNLWPSVRFTDDADLNQQALQWCDTVANRRVHGTTHHIPAQMLVQEQIHLAKLPERTALAPYLREDRTVVKGGEILYHRGAGKVFHLHDDDGPDLELIGDTSGSGVGDAQAI